MSFQGVEFTPDMRKMIVNVKHYFDRVKQDPSVMKERSASQLTADALGIGESTAKKVMASFNKGGEEVLGMSRQLLKLSIL